MASSEERPVPAAPTTGFPQGCAFVDGEFCDISEARISVLDWGLLGRTQPTTSFTFGRTGSLSSSGISTVS